MNAVDTNVLIYAHDGRDADKQAKSVSLLSSLPDAVLLWQVACEYLAASKKLEPLGFDPSQAWQDVEDLGRIWTVIMPEWSTLDTAHRPVKRFSLSFWDAMIVATCLENGIDKLYSEDMGSPATIDGLTLVNPFA